MPKNSMRCPGYPSFNMIISLKLFIINCLRYP